ncbi:MAG: 4-hydroxy-3-methylbut-2-enyl diphosphate reductase [Caldisericaceae bacterium]
MHRRVRAPTIILGTTGFCSGVESAVSKVENLTKAYRNVYTLDAILHNETEMERLRSLGVKEVRENDSNEIIVLPAHGATESEINALEKRFKKIVDVTCPFVLRTENLIRMLKESGYKIVIVGEKHHRETRVLSSIAEDKLLLVASSMEELETFENEVFPKVALLSQSTISKDLVMKVSEFFLRHSFEFRFFDTICPETVKRQNEAYDIAKRVDCVIVVGGKNSSNTRRLVEIASSVNKNTYFLEDALELNFNELAKCSSIGILSGTSTPPYIIKEIIDKLNNLSLP